jgi:hypothetical protein
MISIELLQLVAYVLAITYYLLGLLSHICHRPKKEIRLLVAIVFISDENPLLAIGTGKI